MSLWQTQSWQDMLIASGQSEEYFIIEQNIVSSSLNQRKIEMDKVLEKREKASKKVFVEKRSVSLGEYGLFVIGLEGEYDADLKESLEELCKEERCLFVQVETIDYSMQLHLSFQERIERGVMGEGLKGKEEGKYYKKFIPPYTALIDLTQSEENILKAMKPKGRYNIKLARKKGIIVEQVDTHIGNITKFYNLMCETTERNKFSGNTLEYYKTFLESLDNAQMFFAYHEQEVVAAGIFVVENDIMTYYYGASTNGEKRKRMPTYLLQWTAIEHAIKRGCRVYDFLGVAGDEDQNSSLAGVTVFKTRLSPKKTFVSSSFLFVNKKYKYQAIKLLRKLKK